MLRFIKSFKYAFSGIAYCVLHERNMRIHTVISLYVLFFAQFYNFSKIHYIIIVAAISSVITAELINTSIEKLCNKVSPDKSNIIKIVKDTAAGGVLCSAIGSAIIGLILFVDLNGLLEVFNFFASNFTYCILFLMSIVISVLYIALLPKVYSKHNKEN